MNKADLIEEMAKAAGIKKTEAKDALDAFTKSVAGTLENGGRISLVGFGSFSVSRREAREGRNPQTGAKIQIAAKNIVKFKAGNELNEQVNK